MMRTDLPDTKLPVAAIEACPAMNRGARLGCLQLANASQQQEKKHRNSRHDQSVTSQIMPDPH